MTGLRILAVSMIAFAAACAVPGTDTSTTSSTTSPSGSAGGSDAIPVAEAVADLSAHVGVDPADIVVVAGAAVTWSDGSLGCPQPGMSYTQALVPGYRIVLTAGGVEYAYHGRDGGSPFLCDRAPSGAVRSPDR